MFSAGDSKIKKGRRALRSKPQSIPTNQEREIEELRLRTVELDRVAKMLVRRDLELSEIRMKREQEVQELKEKTKELEHVRSALLNMLEDTEAARGIAEQSRKETELIIQDLADGLLVLNSEGVIELANPRTEHLFRVPQKDLVGKSLKEIKTFPGMKDFAKLLLQGEDRIFRREVEIAEKTLVEITSTPLEQGNEKPGLLVTVHNITREQEIERLKTEFVSLAAHQLRTPLSAIKWSTKMLLDGDEGPLSQEQQELLQKSFESTDRMIRLINDLLNVTKIEEGRYLYQPTLQQVADIAQRMVESYQDTAKQKKIQLELKAPDVKPPRVFVDAEKIQLAMQNLLENALYYTPQGGKVTVAVSYDRKEVQISFSDTGIGIPQKQQSRVFEKFFRARNARKVDTEGSGLGLYLVNNIIKAHGGKVEFESKERVGSTFTFSIPVKKE